MAPSKPLSSCCSVQKGDKWHASGSGQGSPGLSHASRGVCMVLSRGGTDPQKTWEMRSPLGDSSPLSTLLRRRSFTQSTFVGCQLCPDDETLSPCPSGDVAQSDGPGKVGWGDALSWVSLRRQRRGGIWEATGETQSTSEKGQSEYGTRKLRSACRYCPLAIALSLASQG